MSTTDTITVEATSFTIRRGSRIDDDLAKESLTVHLMADGFTWAVLNGQHQALNRSGTWDTLPDGGFFSPTFAVDHSFAKQAAIDAATAALP